MANEVTVGPLDFAPLATSGNRALLNVNVPIVVKATQGYVGHINVITPGSTNPLTINDASTTGGATSANQIVSIPAASLTAGQQIDLNWPCAAGITISSCPTGGHFAISYT